MLGGHHTLAMRAVAIVAVLTDAAVGAGQIVAVRVFMAHGQRFAAFIHV